MLPPKFVTEKNSVKIKCKMCTEIKCKILYEFDWEDYHFMSQNLEFYFFYLFNNSAESFKRKI